MPKPNAALPTPSDDFTLPLAAFLAHLKGTEDEIWSKLLRVKHGTETRVFSSWKQALAALKAS